MSDFGDQIPGIPDNNVCGNKKIENNPISEQSGGVRLQATEVSGSMEYEWRLWSV